MFGELGELVSRILSKAEAFEMIISLGHRLLGVSSDLPGSHHGPGQPAGPEPAFGGQFGATAPLFGLAPGGVYRARPVTRPAGELLPHRFTLTSTHSEEEAKAVCFLWHCPYSNESSGGRYPPPRPLESGLSSRA